MASLVFKTSGPPRAGGGFDSHPPPPDLQLREQAPAAPRAPSRFPARARCPSGKCPASAVLITAFRRPSRSSEPCPARRSAINASRIAQRCSVVSVKACAVPLRLLGQRAVERGQRGLPLRLRASAQRTSGPAACRRAAPGRRLQVSALVEWMLVLASPEIASSTLADVAARVALPAEHPGHADLVARACRRSGTARSRSVTIARISTSPRRVESDGPAEMLDAELVGQFRRDLDERLRLQLRRVRRDPAR